MTKLKKFTAILSVSSFLFVLCTTNTLAAFVPSETEALAEAIISESNFTTNQVAESQVVNDLGALNSIGCVTDQISIAAVSSTGDITYRYDVTDATFSLLEVTNPSDDSLQIDIFEGTLHDTLVFENGSVFLNGNEVIIEETVSRSAAISPRVGFYSDYAAQPFYGTKAADYSKYISTSTKNVSTGTSWASITISAISILIGLAVGGIAGGIAGDLFSRVANNLKSNGEIYAPDSAYFSYSIDKYEHKTLSSAVERYYKYAGTYYAKKDCQGRAAYSNHFEHRYPT